MKILIAFALASGILFSSLPAFGQGYRSYVYKTVKGSPLRMIAKDPLDAKAKNPAIIFFHGGGWTGGDPLSFIDFFDYFNKRGYLTMTVGYRLINTSARTIDELMEDAKDAINYAYQNGDALKLDASRVFLCGYSAGAHLALSSVMIKTKAALARMPRGLVLLSAPVDYAMPLAFYSLGSFLADPRYSAPAAKIKPGLPPMLFIHGTKDRSVSYASVASFVKKMEKKNNDCRLISLKGKDHFFITTSDGLGATLDSMDAFFKSLP